MFNIMGAIRSEAVYFMQNGNIAVVYAKVRKGLRFFCNVFHFVNRRNPALEILS